MTGDRYSQSELFDLVDDPFPSPDSSVTTAQDEGGAPSGRVGRRYQDMPGGHPESSEVDLDIKEYLWLLWARRWIILAVIALVVTLAWMWAMTRQELYRATSTISIDARAPQIIQRSQLLVGPSPWEQSVYLSEQERVLKSYDLAQLAARRIGLLEDNGATMLLGMLTVEPQLDTSLVVLSMTGSDPEKIAEWLNLYIAEYIAYNINDSLNQTRQIYTVIQDELEPLRAQLEESEQRLTSFKKRQDSLLSADQDKNVISEQVNTLTSELAAAKAERIRLETKMAALEELLRRDHSASNIPEVLDDATIRDLARQRSVLELELQKSLQTYRENHPIIRDLRSRIAGIEEDIQEQVDSVITALRLDYEIMKRREQTLLSSLEQLRDESIELSRQVLEYDSLKRAYEQNKLFYESLLARSKEAEIAGSVSFNRVRIIDRARTPTAPISPNVPRTIASFLVLGLALGVGLVLLLNYLDRTIRTPMDVRRSLGLDVFALIPAKTEVSDRMMLEVYQSLRTALMFAAVSDHCQVLLVASAGPGEGKTSTVFNLGKVLAAAGSRVLIIDGDLRKPRFHKLMGESREPGLSTLVLGEKRLHEVVHQLDDYPTLQLITSGRLPPNPPALFGNPAFRRLLEQLRDQYDWILIDSAPIISVTDSVVCSSVVDMVLLVIEYGQLDRKVIEGARHQLARAGATVVGSVLNRVDLKKKVYYYDPGYYSYYYGEEPYGEEPGEEQQPDATGTP